MRLSLTRSGLFINIKHFQPGQLAKLRRKFTIRVVELKEFVTTRNTTKICKIGAKKYLILPRFGGINFIESKLSGKYLNDAAEIKNTIDDGNDPVVPFERTGSFRGNQEVVFNYLVKNQFSQESAAIGKSGAILNLDTGQGKSYLAIAMIEHIQKKTLIVCHNTTVADDWINKHLPTEFPNNKIGTYYGKKKIDGDIIVGIVNSLIKDTFKIKIGRKYVEMSSVEFFGQFGFVVFDESQKYCSKKFSTVLERAQCKYTLALSATPKKSPFYNVSVWWIGDIVIAKDIPGFRANSSKFTGTVKMLKYFGPAEYTCSIKNSMGVTDTASTVNMLCNDIYRTQMIAQEIVKLVDQNLNTFVFADRREYLREIQQLVAKLSNSAITMALMGGSKAEDVLIAEAKCNVIFSTYSYMDTGKSIPKMNAIVFATPRKHTKQALGRILRLGSDESITRQIIDVVDWKTALSGQWYSRKKYYREREFDIEEIKLNHTDFDPEPLIEIHQDYTGAGVELPQPTEVEISIRELEKLINDME